MAAADWVSLIVTLLFLAFAMAHDHKGETETFHVSAGHLFVLRCRVAGSQSNVTWSKGGTHNLSLPTGVEVKAGRLWFLPVQTSHNGSYTCETRVRTMKFRLSVSSGECPDPPENISIHEGVSEGLPCKQTEIFRLTNKRTIQWLKDCHPVKRQGEPISVNQRGFMRLPAASKLDEGKYTCLVNIDLDGRTYTAARSIQLTVDDDLPNVFIKHEMVYAQQKEVVVEVGARVELNCLAYIGFSEDNEINIYWTINSTFSEHYKEVKETHKNVTQGRRVLLNSTLSISEVLPQFLNVPIHCIVESPAERTFDFVWLREGSHSTSHIIVPLCLSASVALLAMAAAFPFLKVDLVLAYRKLMRHFTKQQDPDGKFYDAYVSFLNPNTLQRSAETAKFALQILPEKLEKQHGFSLYIRGRDDCPGEAVHDVIAATVRQCHRLLIILSSESIASSGSETEDKPSQENWSLLCYEQKIGLYDALTQNDPRVILVEIDDQVDYSCLPESLRYIKRKQGSLKWKKPSLRTHKLSKLSSNKIFWKTLRYYMPSVPAGRVQIIV